MNNGHKENLLLKIRKAISIGAWKASLMGLSKSRNSSSEPGLVFIQIDGFSMSELKKAFERNEMPFLKKLLLNFLLVNRTLKLSPASTLPARVLELERKSSITREKYKLYPYYQGLPSTTPVVQGELNPDEKNKFA